MDADLPISFVYNKRMLRCYPIWKQNKSEIRNCFGNIPWYFVYYFLFYVDNAYAIFSINFKLKHTHCVTVCEDTTMNKCNYIPKSQETAKTLQL